MTIKVSHIWFLAGLWVILDLLTGFYNSQSILCFALAVTGVALWPGPLNRARSG